ncbi:hypothetical protein NLG97_g6758 [Lecanicillium saksenae]|uniref:Uncharacterized protein n=1 Tax=Lecanicillium saksenae TaxID=468837 RepID=A0ACC1QQB6_9HYPO|nr:hypothetical protein NLG97_g6758 [Lecanicillium saksenae]
MDRLREGLITDKQEGHRHVRIHPECSLCGCYFEVGEPMIALLGDRANSSCRVIDASTFPMAIYCNQRHGTPWMFCQFPKCTKCAGELESVTVHRDCYQIFLQQTAKHEHITAYNLWHAAHARYPWRGFWPLPLTVLGKDAAGLARAHATAEMGIPLDTLPNELVLQICENVRQSIFWRYILAQEFIRRLVAEADRGAAKTTVLSRIDSWKRGSEPQPATSESGSYLRLTIDSYGLREIERLSSFPTKSVDRSEAHAHVVDTVQRLGQIAVSLDLDAFTRKRACGPCGLGIHQHPPVLPDYEFSPELQPICPRLGTIETKKSFGITFFISSGQIAAIHAHTLQAPSAYSCFQRLNPVKKRWVAWIFVPLRGGIDKFGFRTPLLPPGAAVLPQFAGNLLLQMSISGEVMLGPYIPLGKDYWMEDDPTTLIHGISRMGAVYPLGTASRDEEGEEEEVFYRNPLSLAAPFDHAYFSYAELHDVASVEVYHDKALHICRGVLVRYSNGGERALGQCRIGVDAVRVFEQPTCFCYKKTKYLRQGTRVHRDSVTVECHPSVNHDHSENGWFCVKFPSRLEWWFTSEESRISYTPGLEGQRQIAEVHDDEQGV